MNVRNFRNNSRETVSVSKIFDEYCRSAPDKILQFFLLLNPTCLPQLGIQGKFYIDCFFYTLRSVIRPTAEILGAQLKILEAQLIIVKGLNPGVISQVG